MSESENPTPLDIPAALEALLFVSAEPVPPAQLATAMQISVAAVEQGLSQLDGELQTRGLRLQRHLKPRTWWNVSSASKPPAA
jgi:chromosome segregation and condensation protein ScpB